MPQNLKSLLQVRHKEKMILDNFLICTIIEWEPPVKHDTILYRTCVLLCVFIAFYTGPIHINHELYRATPYNIPPDANFTLQHLLAAIKQIRGIQCEAAPKIRILDHIHQAKERRSILALPRKPVSIESSSSLFPTISGTQR